MIHPWKGKVFDLEEICEFIGGRMERGKCVVSVEGIAYDEANEMLILGFENDVNLYAEASCGRVNIPLDVGIVNMKKRVEANKLLEEIRELHGVRKAREKKNKDTSDIDRKIEELERRLEEIKPKAHKKLNSNK